MRRAHTGFIGAILAASFALAGCSGPANTGPEASASPSPTATVLRASQADRDAAATAMRAVTDQLGGLAWASAESLAALPSVEDRTNGGGYDKLMGLTGSGSLDAATAKVVPLLSGKSMDDFALWQDFQGKAVHLASALQQWGAGDDGARADAEQTLKDARTDIEKLRR